MVSAAQRRDAARSLQSHFRVSERRACRVIRLSRAVCRYVSVRPPQDALRRRIREIAETRIRYGYLRIQTVLRREGLVVNRKRVHRFTAWKGFSCARGAMSALPTVRVRSALRVHAMMHGRWTLSPSAVMAGASYAC